MKIKARFEPGKENPYTLKTKTHTITGRLYDVLKKTGKLGIDSTGVIMMLHECAKYPNTFVCFNEEVAP